MNLLITAVVLMLVQFIFFGALVARARSTLQVQAPTMTGPDAFDRLVLMLPLMASAAHFWNPAWVAAAGALFFLGRSVYWKGYVEQPAKRMLGNIFTMVAISACLLATVAGLVRSAL